MPTNTLKWSFTLITRVFLAFRCFRDIGGKWGNTQQKLLLHEFGFIKLKASSKLKNSRTKTVLALRYFPGVLTYINDREKSGKDL